MSTSIYKVVIVGTSGIGKTAILHRLVEGAFLDESQPTIGVEFKSFECRTASDLIRLNIWDTAGQEKFRSVSKAYFRNAVGAVLVFSLSDRGSFEALDGWLNDIHSLCAPNAALLFLGNKSDLRDGRVVAASEAQLFAQRHTLEYIETSALNATNITETFVRLANAIHEKVLKNEIRGNFLTPTAPVLLTPRPPQPNVRQTCC
jgi:small GTP-binding protein